MLIEIRSYRGIDRADVSLSPKVTLIAGDNHTGKSSFIQGLQAVCAAEPNLFGLTKADAKAYVNRGANEATVTLKDENGTRRISYPSLEPHSLSGAATLHRQGVLGLLKLSKLTPNERAKALEQYAAQQADRPRLEVELKECGVTVADQTKILDTVFGNGKIPGMGWDKGEAIAKTECTTRKGMFQQVTGVKWGSTQGLTFQPEGWDYDLVEAKLEDLEKAVVDAREAHVSTIRENVLTEAEMERLKEVANSVQDLDKQLYQAGLEYEKLSTAAQALEKKLAQAKADAALITCGSCSIKGTVQGGKLVVKNNVVCLDSASMAELVQEVNAATKARDEQRAVTLSLQVQIREAKEAGEKAKNADVAPIEDATAIDTASDALATAELRLKAFKQKKQGTAFHHQIIALDKAAKAMGSDGLRKRVLIQNLKPFNDKVSEVCRAAGWGTVTIDAELEIRYDDGKNGNAPFVLCSESEQWLINATLQVAIALIEKAPLLVFDGAEILMKEERNRFFNLLRDLQLTAVVGISCSRDKDGKPIDCPNFSQLGRGMTYWVEKSTIVLLSQHLQSLEPQAVSA
ncbi:MAG: hypothetical protein C0469_07750 [Cyanobacteria bacterium DS2.3.42]|nr:hypothetical protein [Cyanobacteria bacterium DS2.3.42]